MTSLIVLIGPVGVGKSTTARLLADHLQLPHYALDELRWTYFAEIGYNARHQQQIWETQGMAGVLAYWEPFEVYALERILAEHDAGVIDVGGGYTIATDPPRATRVRAILAPYPNVILLLPTPHVDESVHVLAERLTGYLPDHFPLQTHVQQHFGTQDLAKMVVYTHTKAPETIRDEIVGFLRSQTRTHR